jgi:DNA polymerase-1
MLLQVHDELLLEVREGAIDAVAAQVKEEMESAMSLDVPLKVDIASGRSWYECKAG